LQDEKSHVLRASHERASHLLADLPAERVESAFQNTQDELYDAINRLWVAFLSAPQFD
jgi:hypothetical protein